MKSYIVKHKNITFKKQRVELDGKSFDNCTFEDCLIILEQGDTQLHRCSFNNCRLILRGNAYNVGQIIKIFTGKRPLKVLDLDEPLLEKPESADEIDCLKEKNEENSD